MLRATASASAVHGRPMAVGEPCWSCRCGDREALAMAGPLQGSDLNQGCSWVRKVDWRLRTRVLSGKQRGRT